MCRSSSGKSADTGSVVWFDEGPPRAALLFFSAQFGDYVKSNGHADWLAYFAPGAIRASK
jgi:hypothetical protein